MLKPILLAILVTAAPLGAAAATGADSTRAPRPMPPDLAPAQSRPIVDVITEADSLVRARGGAHADHARLLLTWRAPWGSRRAVTNLVPKLSDTTGVDTLYLCVQPGRSNPTFNGFMAKLRFRCAAGDTLGTFWRFERTGANAGALGVQFGPDPGFPCPQPWTVPGTGKPAWVPTSDGAELKMIFAVPYTQAGPVDSSTVYALARVFIRHTRASLQGSAQPMCIEWEEASLAFGLRDDPVVRQGERFVSWNDPKGLTCRPAHVPGRPPGWKAPLHKPGSR